MTIQAKAEMLIRASPSTAFRAFTSKDNICKFWLDYASDDLSDGAKVEWHFMVPGAKEAVSVNRFVQDQQITFKWSDGLLVDIKFADYDAGQTGISVVVTGFTGVHACEHAIGATEGFAIVLCDLKAFLETGLSGGMVKGAAKLIANAQNKKETR